MRKLLPYLLLIAAFAGCGRTPPPDTTPPELLSAFPGDGYRGFQAGEQIVLEFSEPMDTASVEAAFVLTRDGATAWPVTYAWEDGGRRVRIQPNPPLPYSPNSDDETFLWKLADTAKDPAGNPLPRSHQARFTTLRTLTTRLPAEAIDGMTFAPPGTVELSNSTATYAWVGDRDTGKCAYAFFSFDPGALPADLVSLKDAALVVYASGAAGTPYADLGGALELDHVDYGETLEDADAALPPLTDANGDPETRQVATAWTSGWYAVPVLQDWLRRDLEAGRAHFQVRYRFPVCSDGDGQHDYLTLVTSEDTNGNAPYVYVEFLAP
ncbi:Ig-like domain-containing protein [Oceanithermus profundus]